MKPDTIHEVVVLSGKGGTGKTSITAALAMLAGKEAVIADCDVDAANMHLLLQPDFGNTVDFYSGNLAILDQDLCTRCGKCAEVCRFHAIPNVDGYYRIRALDCEGCGYCEIVCPVHAITMEARKSGYVYQSKTKAGSTMVHARLDTGAENSGKLVAKVKNDAKAIAALEQKHFIIVDGSPGIGCPVVSSLAGASYVILVTEPTLSGLHDLNRVYAVIQRFRIKTGCIINKSDLNPERTDATKQYLAENQVEHLADIPYHEVFSRAMIREKTIVELKSPLTPMLEAIWNRVQEQLTIHR